MRIALVTESFYPAVDGATTTVRQVADRLVDTGHEVLVLAPAPGLGSYRGSRVARIRPLEPLGPGRTSPGTQVRTALAAFGPDLVHVTSPGEVGRRALRSASRLGLPTLVVQQAPVAPAAGDVWRRTVASRADHLVVTSAWMRDLLATVRVPGAALWTPGVDVREFTPHLRDADLHAAWSRRRVPGPDRVVVGFLGSLHRRHDVRRLAEVARVPGVRLVVVGEGPERGWLERAVPGARFTGGLRGRDLAVALASLDALVHPGSRETCSHALREASASGVPVVAPAAGGALDAVAHGVTGLLADPRDPHGLGRAVQRLVADPALRRRLGAAGREAAGTRSWETAVDELVATHYPSALRRLVGAGAA